MNWIEFVLSSIKRVRKVRVTYSLITNAGNEIINIDEEYPLDTPVIFECEEFFSSHKKIKERISEEQKPIFDKRALELLKAHTSFKLVNIKNGYLYSGNYIVKCDWGIYFDTENVTWKEYKKNKKEVDAQLKEV